MRKKEVTGNQEGKRFSGSITRDDQNTDCRQSH